MKINILINLVINNHYFNPKGYKGLSHNHTLPTTFLKAGVFIMKLKCLVKAVYLSLVLLSKEYL